MSFLTLRTTYYGCTLFDVEWANTQLFYCLYAIFFIFFNMCRRFGMGGKKYFEFCFVICDKIVSFIIIIYFFVSALLNLHMFFASFSFVSPWNCLFFISFYFWIKISIRWIVYTYYSEFFIWSMYVLQYSSHLHCCSKKKKKHKFL